LRGNTDRVDGITVQIRNGGNPTQFLQFFNGPNTNNFFQIITDPQWNRRTPISIARDGPVTRIRQPVGKTLLLNKVRHPSCMRIILKQAIGNMLDLDKP